MAEDEKLLTEDRDLVCETVTLNWLGEDSRQPDELQVWQDLLAKLHEVNDG